MLALSRYRGRWMSAWAVWRGEFGLVLCRHRWPWSSTDADEGPPDGRARRLLLWGHWCVVAFWPSVGPKDCAGPAREPSGMPAPGVDNDPRSGGPWAPLDGATAEALDGLRPGCSRRWWDGYLERTGPQAGLWSHGGLTHALRREDHVWSLERLPSVAVIGVTP